MPGPGEGLDALVRTAKTPIMREIAAIALARGLTLGHLVRKLNERDGSKLETSNVRENFRSKQPQLKTIESYLDILARDEAEKQFLSEALRILCEDPRKGELEIWENELREHLISTTAQFPDGAVAEALKIFDAIKPPNVRNALIITYKRAFVHAQLNAHALQDTLISKIPSPSSSLLEEKVSIPLAAFIRAFKKHYDLEIQIVHDDPKERLLWSLWVHLTLMDYQFRPSQADSIIATVIGVLRADGIETRTMEEVLFREKASLENSFHSRIDKEETSA